ncbi:MAG: hypothetical protein ACLR00_24190 [Klebsiella michiganensis]
MTNNQLTEVELQTLIIELQQTAYRLNGTNSAYLMSDAIKPLRELQERRKAAMDSEPVAWLAIYHGEVYDEAIGITRSVVEAQADHFGWESALTEIIPLYRHAQPTPVVPDQMLCEFYEVANWPDLVRELVKHVEQLQDSARRNVKPWEDTFPETLLPAYIERVKQADDVCRAAMLNGGKS